MLRLNAFAKNTAAALLSLSLENTQEFTLAANHKRRTKSTEMDLEVTPMFMCLAAQLRKTTAPTA